MVMQMPNPGQPTIASGATGDVVRRLQRALRRTPIPGLRVDGVFGPPTEAAIKDFQRGARLAVDAVVGPLTWAALPDGGPMPTLEEGAIGAVVRSLQESSPQTAHPASGIRRRAHSMESSAHIPKFRCRRFRLGAA